MDWGIVIGVVGTLGGTAAGVGITAFVKNTARDEAERRIKETLRGELAIAFTAFKVDLNGTYLHKGVAEARFDSVEREISGLKDEIHRRPCIARPRHVPE